MFEKEKKNEVWLTQAQFDAKKQAGTLDDEVDYLIIGKIIGLPTLPTSDGTYKLQCVVSNGTATLSWVAE